MAERLGPALDAAFEHGLERLVGGVLAVEGQIVAEQDEALVRPAQQAEQVGQGLDVLAMDLDEDQRLAMLVADLRVDRLDDGALAGAARAPEQGVVRRQAAGEA